MTDKHHYPVKPPLQLVYLVLTIMGCTILGMLICMLIIAMVYGGGTFVAMGSASVNSPPDVINALKIFLAIGNTLSMFLAPAIFFGYLIMHDPDDYLKPGTNFNLLLIPLVLLIMFALAR